MKRVQLSAVAEVTYFCELNEDDSQKVQDYMEENEVELDEAVNDLMEMHEIDIYNGLTLEGDCNTTDVYDIEFCDEDEED